MITITYFIIILYILQAHVELHTDSCLGYTLLENNLLKKKGCPSKNDQYLVR